MGKLLKAVRKAFARACRFTFSADAAARARRALEEIVELASELVPIVRLVAAMTPTQLDDAIVAIIGKLVALDTLTDTQRCAVLKQQAVILTRRIYPSIPDRTLYAAIDIAHAWRRAAVAHEAGKVTA